MFAPSDVFSTPVASFARSYEITSTKPTMHTYRLVITATAHHSASTLAAPPFMLLHAINQHHNRRISLPSSSHHRRPQSTPSYTPHSTCFPTPIPYLLGPRALAFHCCSVRFHGPRRHLVQQRYLLRPQNVSAHPLPQNTPNITSARPTRAPLPPVPSHHTR